MSYPERICIVTGCRRPVLRSERCVYNRCQAHVSALLTGAFGSAQAGTGGSLPHARLRVAEGSPLARVPVPA